MHLTTRRAIVLAALSLPLMAAQLTAQSNRSITGDYTAQGRNPDGSAYNGTVSITEQNGVVGMAWQVASQNYIGTGTRDGRVVTVDWGSDAPVIYVVMGNGELHGTWARGRALELLTPN